MIKNIVDNCIVSIKDKDFPEVYRFYDGIEIEQKSKNMFCVIALKKMTANEIMPSEKGFIYNFNADVNISLISLEGASYEDVYDTLQNIIIPRIAKIYKISEFSIGEIKYNYKIRRFTLDTLFKICGTYGGL